MFDDGSAQLYFGTPHSLHSGERSEDRSLRVNGYHARDREDGYHAAET